MWECDDDLILEVINDVYLRSYSSIVTKETQGLHLQPKWYCTDGTEIRQWIYFMDYLRSWCCIDYAVRKVC